MRIENPSETSGSARKVILIVEDDLSIREYLRETLEIEGYSVRCASNGLEGLHEVEKSPRPSLILLDLMMPVMDGLQFLESFAHNPARSLVPVIVVTAFPEQTVGLACEGIIKKPMDVELLLKTIQTQCEL